VNALTTPRHPARYSKALLPVIARALEPAGEFHRVLDPFAGVGGVHALAEFGHRTTGVELEPEWAHQHPDTLTADARTLGSLFAPGSFDAVATSPAYGNRMADTYAGDARGSLRRTYRVALGRPLSEGSGAALQWGDAYRQLHREAWEAVVPLLRPGGRFVLNMRDHTRAGVRQRVTDWHLEVLADLGLELGEVLEVATPGWRFGANTSERWPEVVAVLTVPETEGEER
jgi:tRNA G10  N-methylase Trm11